MATVGCINTPDALELQLAPRKTVFAPNEPVILDTTLIAVDGPVCLDKVVHFNVDIQRTDARERMESPPVAFCGGAFLHPLYPVIASVALLDVADLLDRYVVLSPGKEQRQTVRLFSFDSQHVWTGAIDDDPWLTRPPYNLPSGKYHLVLTLATYSDLYPAPLFWKVYDQPIVAETDFRIEEAPTTVESTP
jgi:hypothetical protein